MINDSATVGDSVTLVCNSSSAKPVNWWFQDETEVVVEGKVVNGNSVRMTLVGYDLIIHNVLPNDTGMYTCVEKTGFGEHHKTWLAVSGFCFIDYFYRLTFVLRFVKLYTFRNMLEHGHDVFATDLSDKI